MLRDGYEGTEPFYAILRAIPSKIGGVIAMFGALLILLLPLAFSRLFLRTNRYRPLLTVFFWIRSEFDMMMYLVMLVDFAISRNINWQVM